MLGQRKLFSRSGGAGLPESLVEPAGFDGSLEGSSLETVRHMVVEWRRHLGCRTRIGRPKSWPVEGAVDCNFAEFAARRTPYRRVVIAWRATFPRPQAIEALLRARLCSRSAAARRQYSVALGARCFT